MQHCRPVLISVCGCFTESMTGMEDSLLLKTAGQCCMLLAWSWYSLQELESSEEWPQLSRKWSLRARPALPAGSKVLLEQKVTDLFAICDQEDKKGFITNYEQYIK